MQGLFGPTHTYISTYTMESLGPYNGLLNGRCVMQSEAIVSMNRRLASYVCMGETVSGVVEYISLAPSKENTLFYPRSDISVS